MPPGGNASACARSWRESDGYICEADSYWELRRAVLLKSYAANVRYKTNHDQGRGYFQENWLPELHCPLAERLGAHGDGGKFTCDPLYLATKPCLVYSIGASEEHVLPRMG